MKRRDQAISPVADGRESSPRTEPAVSRDPHGSPTVESSVHTADTSRSVRIAEAAADLENPVVLALTEENERLRAVVDVVKGFDDPPTEEQLDALSVVLSYLEKGIPASEVFGD